MGTLRCLGTAGRSHGAYPEGDGLRAGGGLRTDYSYDTLGNRTLVTQTGVAENYSLSTGPSYDALLISGNRYVTVPASPIGTQ